MPNGNYLIVVVQLWCRCGEPKNTYYPIILLSCAARSIWLSGHLKCYPPILIRNIQNRISQTANSNSVAQSNTLSSVFSPRSIVNVIQFKLGLWIDLTVLIALEIRNNFNCTCTLFHLCVQRVNFKKHTENTTCVCFTFPATSPCTSIIVWSRLQVVWFLFY